MLRAFQKLAPGERFATLSVVPGITMNHLLLVCGYGLIFLLVYELAVGAGDRRWVMIFPPLAIVGLEALLGTLTS